MSQPPQYPPPGQPPGGWGQQPPGSPPPGQPPGWGQQPPAGQPPGWGQQPPPGQPPGWGQPSGGQPPGPLKGNNTALIVILAVLAVVLIGGGAAFVLTQDDDEDGGSTSTADGTSEEDEPTDDTASPEEQEFITALAEANDASSEGLITADEAECLAEITVDAVGLETLQAATSPQEISDDPEASLVDLGVEVDQSQVDQMAAATTGCIDVMEIMVDSIEQDGGSAELAACVEENLSPEVAATRLAAEYIGSQAARASAEADFNGAIEPCEEVAE